MKTALLFLALLAACGCAKFKPVRGIFQGYCVDQILTDAQTNTLHGFRLVVTNAIATKLPPYVDLERSFPLLVDRKRQVILSPWFASRRLTVCGRLVQARA